ncbi:hypothetical protein [Rhodospirillum sp. A1_3_36]|uniref:hypothetical protein n=1 Tax=Rhodospirillum sp. A1_3_36 TaxID=3391666 RepID=UPI0039A74F1C
MGDYDVFREKVQGRNINPETLLATDYLNHFNEVIMLLEMVPDMPDILEDCKEWRPKSYQAHFRDSSFSDKDLAIEGYEHAPAQYKIPFEETLEQMNFIAVQSIARVEQALAEGNMDVGSERARAASRNLQKLMDVASSIIHGAQKTMHQSEIDAMLDL